MTVIASRTALVTGSTRGIGFEIAQRLAAEGVEVVVHGRDSAAVRKAAGKIGRVGGVVGDLANPEAVRTIADEALSRFGRIDILVNNAGASAPGSFLGTSDDVWHRLLAVNLHAPRQLVQRLLPGMLECGWGRILNVTSIAAVQATPGFSAYAASKGALLSFSLTLAKEVARSGVRVNALAPLALTDMVKSQVTPAALEHLSARGFPTVADCAEQALLLLSEAAPNGQFVAMDFTERPANDPWRHPPPVP